MKKNFLLFLISLLFISCGNCKNKKNGVEQAIGLKAKTYFNSVQMFETVDDKNLLHTADMDEEFQILEFQKYNDVLKVKLLPLVSSKNKTGLWCNLSDIYISTDDYEFLASDLLFGLSYTYELLKPRFGYKTEQYHPLLCKVIEIAHEKKVSEEKIIKAFEIVIDSNKYSNINKDFYINSPLYCAAKYDYSKVIEYLLPFCPDFDLDMKFQPEDENIITCTVKNNSIKTLCYLLSEYNYKDSKTLLSLTSNENIKDILIASTNISDFNKALLKLQQKKEEPKNRKYEWNVCKAMNDVLSGKGSVENAYIKADANTRVNMRKDPDLSSEKVGAVYNNSLVTVLKMSEDKSVINGTASEWLYIRSSENIEGWVFGDFVYVELSEPPSYKIQEQDAYFFNMDENKVFSRCETKIIYQNLDEDIIKPNEKLLILDYFDYSNPDYVYQEGDCIFPYCLVRTQKGKTGVVNCRDICNYRTGIFDRYSIAKTIYKGFLSITVLDGNSKISTKKIYKVSFIDSENNEQEVFLPGSRIYSNYPVFDIFEKNDIPTKTTANIVFVSERISKFSNDQKVTAYTLKDGRLYIFAEWDEYVHTKDFMTEISNISQFNFSDFQLEVFTYNPMCDDFEKRFIQSEAFKYGPLESDPQIYVLKEHKEGIIPVGIK